MKKTNVRLGFFSVMLIVAFIITGNKYTFICIFAATLHELGHLIAASLIRVQISQFALGIFGARLKIANSVYSYKQEIFLCVGGPLANLLSALLAFFLFDGENVNIFITFSLFLSLLNLLPIRTFDGGRIFECLLMQMFSLSFSKRVLDIISFLIIFFLWSVSVYFLLIYGSSLNLFIFSASLFSSLFISEGNKRFL